MKPSKLYFIRHGETDWNAEGRLQGHRDIPLNETGIAQSKKVSAALQKLIGVEEMQKAPPRFFVSPLHRTRQTAELLRASINLPPHDYTLDARIQEMSFGLWEGMTWKEIRRSDIRNVDLRDKDPWTQSPPQGESYEVVAERVGRALRDIPDGSVMIAHGGIARALFVLLAGQPVRDALKSSIFQGRVLVFERGHYYWTS